MLIDTVALGAAVASYVTAEVAACEDCKPDTPCGEHAAEFEARMRISASIMAIADGMAARPWYRCDDPTIPDDAPVWAFSPDLGRLPFEARNAADIRKAQALYKEQYTYWIMERTLQTPPTPPSVASGPNVAAASSN